MNYIFPGTESGVFSLHIRGIKIIAEGGGRAQAFLECSGSWIGVQLSELIIAMFY